MKDWQELNWRAPKEKTKKRIAANITRKQLHEAIKKASAIQPEPGKEVSLSQHEKREMWAKIIAAAREVDAISKKHKVEIYFTTK